MKWRVLVAVGALGAGVVWAAHRRARQEERDAALWAEATDTVDRFGS